MCVYETRVYKGLIGVSVCVRVHEQYIMTICVCDDDDDLDGAIRTYVRSSCVCVWVLCVVCEPDTSFNTRIHTLDNVCLCLLAVKLISYVQYAAYVRSILIWPAFGRCLYKGKATVVKPQRWLKEIDMHSLGYRSVPITFPLTNHESRKRYSPGVLLFNTSRSSRAYCTQCVGTCSNY